MNKVIKRILIVALAVWAVLATFLFVVALSVCYDLSDKKVATEKELASLQKDYEYLSAERGGMNLRKVERTFKDERK
ncbi:MAG: hypothetical protein IJ465_08225 [Clostridia bacterium]|nr:hypothetical protein [Clostridia bacterium]